MTLGASPDHLVDGARELQGRAVPRVDSSRNVADDALRTAIKAYLDAGDLERVRALVEVLSASSREATVVDLKQRKK